MKFSRSAFLAAFSLTLPLLGGELGAQDTRANEFRSWGGTLPLDPKAFGEIMRFRGDSPLTEAYASAFARELRSRVLSAAEAGVSRLLAGACEPFLDVSIGEVELDLLPGAAAEKDAEKRREDFERSLIRTETVACFEVGESDPGEVLEIYIGPDFRMKAESRILRMWTDPEGSCLETKGVMGLVDPSQVCNHTSDFRAADVAAHHSQVVFNQGNKPYQEVYFKDSLKSFVRIPGGVALHYINFTRAQSLGRIERWVGAGQIEDSQKETVRELLRILSR